MTGRVPSWIALVVAMLVMAGLGAAAVEAQPPEVTIWVEKAAKSTCKAKGDCKLSVVSNRGLGVCKSPKKYTPPGANPKIYCADSFEWRVKTKGVQLSNMNKIVIEWSPYSTRGSQYCLDQESYELEEPDWEVEAKVEAAASQCFPKSAWFYDVILYYEEGTDLIEVDREDPGVIIDN